MSEFSSQLMSAVRDRFAHVDSCPEQGPRIFFENAGGALTLKSVVERSNYYASIPDNQGRANSGSQALVDTIKQAKDDMHSLMNASAGQFFVGESGTELIFRLVTAACVETTEGGTVLGTTLEHPATRSACARWSKIARQKHVLVDHDVASGTVSAQAYADQVTPDTCVATIVHTSPVTGMGVDIAAVSAAIRSVSPHCLIIVDGIQHAAHGQIDIDSYDVDGYVISPYKMFSRHGFGVAWISDRMAALEHNNLVDGPADNWEMGTRDTGAYATMSDIHEYLCWLGSEVSDKTEAYEKILAAGKAIHNHEQALTHAMLNGIGNLMGLADMPGVNIIGGVDNPNREGLVAFYVDDKPAADIVEALNQRAIRTHVRKNDHYSSNILTPLQQDSCVRVSLCHYNSLDEVKEFLTVCKALLDG